MTTRVVPPFSLETATLKVRLAEDAWNRRDPERVALAYSEDSRWRNRAEFFSGRPAIVALIGGRIVRSSPASSWLSPTITLPSLVWRMVETG